MPPLRSVLLMGFPLNCSSLGVYFNDSTKNVYLTTRDSFLYVERRTTSNGEVQEPMSIYTLSNYLDDNLKKKATLL